jgi:RNA polymerase sigma factor (sigma-70 family)
MENRAEAFTACWHSEAPRLLAYARRHVGPDEAADVVAETFLVAWRRWHEIPKPAIGWLLRTAAGVIKNRSRSTLRRDRLTDKIALLNHAAAAVSDTAEAVVRRDEALRRLAALNDDQREALLLVSWDGLSTDEAAAVLRLRPATFRKRLSRARELLNHDESPPFAGERSLVVPTPLISQEMS